MNMSPGNQISAALSIAAVAGVMATSVPQAIAIIPGGVVILMLAWVGLVLLRFAQAGDAVEEEEVAPPLPYSLSAPYQRPFGPWNSRNSRIPGWNQGRFHT